jgi:hypothetical protein
MIVDNFEEIAKQLERIKSEEEAFDQQAANEPDLESIRQMVEDELIEFMLYESILDSSL